MSRNPQLEADYLSPTFASIADFCDCDTMKAALEEFDAPPLLVRPSRAMKMGENDFFEFCQINSGLRIERTAEGNLIIMAPEGASTGLGNSELHYYFANWAKRDGTGRLFGPTAGFILPNKAMRAPDISWVQKARLARFSKKDFKKFLPLCPDFVLELRSESDSLSALKEKMEEYMANGARLGWLLEPMRKQAFIYHPGKNPEATKKPGKLWGEPVLKRFVLDLPKIWGAMEGN